MKMHADDPDETEERKVFGQASGPMLEEGVQQT